MRPPIGRQSIVRRKQRETIVQGTRTTVLATRHIRHQPLMLEESKQTLIITVLLYATKTNGITVGYQINSLGRLGKGRSTWNTLQNYFRNLSNGKY